MWHIRTQKLKNHEFEERNITTEWAVQRVKEQGNWLTSRYKPSEVRNHWDTLVGVLDQSDIVKTHTKKRGRDETQSKGAQASVCQLNVNEPIQLAGPPKKTKK